VPDLPRRVSGWGEVVTMSYDIYLRSKKCDTCGHEPDGPEYLPNPTYNLTGIFDRALTGEPLPNPEVGEAAVVLFGKATDRPRGLRVLSGRKARDTAPWIAKALAHLKNPAEADAFRALEPENRWGTLKDAQWVMERLLEAAEQYPDHVWEIR
jgi:hypothetical protein